MYPENRDPMALHRVLHDLWETVPTLVGGLLFVTLIVLGAIQLFSAVF